MAMKQSTAEASTSIVDPQDTNETLFEFDRLPNAIAVEIMSRTAVESLQQLKLVNKKTYSLIKTLMTNPKFVAKHLHHRTSEAANNASASLIYSCLILGPEKGRDYEPIVPLLTLLGNNQGDVEEHRLRSFSIEEDDLMTLTYDLKVGHCDGIVVLLSESMFLSLCNPALRELVTFCLESKIDRWTGLSSQCPVEGIGIGYDSSSECYKVVRILYSFDFFKSTLRAEVYTLAPGTKSWREVEISVSDWNRSLRLSSSVYFKGSCYWLMVDRILSFEMSSEAFWIVNPPDYHNSETILEPRLRLAMWNGSVCLLCYDKKVGQQSSNYIRKWVMEIGEAEGDRGRARAYSWRECPSIRLEPGIFKAPLTFWKEDELLVSIEDDQMGCYNVAIGELRTVPVFHGECRTLCSNPYVASLVSVKEITGYGK